MIYINTFKIIYINNIFCFFSFTWCKKNKTSIFTNLVEQAKKGEIGQGQGLGDNNSNNNQKPSETEEETTENPTASLQKLNEQPRPDDGSTETIINDLSDQQGEETGVTTEITENTQDTSEKYIILMKI